MNSRVYEFSRVFFFFFFFLESSKKNNLNLICDSHTLVPKDFSNQFSPP